MPRGGRYDDRDLKIRDHRFLIRRPPPGILRSAAINLQSVGAVQAAADQQKIARVSHNRQIVLAPAREPLEIRGQGFDTAVALQNRHQD